ncbi:PIN domain-containing protein [Actinoplanes sp. CA-131856]
MAAIVEDRYMILRRGQSMRHAIDVLQERIRQGENASNVVRMHQLLSHYVSWVRESEIQLRQVFADTEVVDKLFTPRHWHLRANGVAEDLAIGPGVFHDEFDAQRRMLQEVVDNLSGFLELADRPGKVCVLDTNTIMHWRPFNEVTWPQEIGVKQVRLMIPLLVLDELDEKTYSGNKQLAGRAEKRLILLDQHLEAAVKGASAVREGVTVEILRDPADHRRNPDADYEILNRAEFVQQVCDDAVRVVSGDRGMRVRGMSRDILVQPLSAKWRLALSEDNAATTAPKQSHQPVAP